MAAEMGGVRPWQTAGREIVCGQVSGWHSSAGTAFDCTTGRNAWNDKKGHAGCQTLSLQ